MDAELRRAVAAATLAAGLLIAQQVAGKSVRDALFLSTFDVSALPAVMMASALVSVLAVLALSRALRHASPFRVEPLALGAASLLLGAWWALSVAAPRLAAVAFYLHMALFGATLVSGFWSVVNERFDPHTAKRAVGRIGVGAAFGGVAGGCLAWAAAGVVPVPGMLLLMALLNLACLPCVLRLRPARPAVPPPRPPSAPHPAETLARVPYVRNLALVVALGALVEALVDYVLKARAAAALTAGPELMSFFAAFHTGAGVLGLLAQALLSRASLRGLGLAGTVSLRPGAVLVGSALSAVEPRLWTAILASGTQEMLSNSLFRSGYELLYTPLPEAEKRPTKSIVDVGFDKLGALVGGAVAFAVVATAPTLATRVLSGLAALVCLAALAVTSRLHRGYVRTLEQSLRAGRVRLEISDVQDQATLMTLAQSNLSLDRESLLREIDALRGGSGATGPLAASGETRTAASTLLDDDPLLRSIADLRSAQPDRVRQALRRSPSEPSLVPHLVPLLGRNELFLDVLRALRTLAPGAVGQLVDALVDPGSSPVVRRRIPRVLKACPTQRAADGLRLGLEDKHLDVRAQCGLALASIARKSPAVSLPRDALYAVVLRELERGARAWKREAEGAAPPGESGTGAAHAAADRGLDHVFTLLSLVLEPEPLQVALAALRGQDQALRGTALEYLENVLPDGVRRALWPHIGARAALLPRTPRARQQLVDDLLRSGDGLTLGRSGVRPKGRRPE